MLDRRNIRVNGKQYVLHIARGEKTLCGRLVAKVNCYGSTLDVERYANDLEATCRACAAAYAVGARI